MCVSDFLAAPPSQPSTPSVTMTTTQVFKITFTVQDGSSPITSFLLNITELVARGGSATFQQLIDIDDVSRVESVLVSSDGDKEVVLVVGGLQQLTHYTFQVSAVSAAGEGEFSDPSSPMALGKL